MRRDKSFDEIEQENYDKMLDAFVTYNQSKDVTLKFDSDEERKEYKAELADNLEKIAVAQTQEEIEKIVEENAGDEAFQEAMSAMEIMKPEEYVVRGALLCCSGGSHRRRLNLPECHGVYIGCNPIMHSGDCITGIEGSGIHITSFGVCNGTSNGALSEGDISLATEVVDEQGVPIIGETNGGVITGKRCRAMISNNKWDNAHTSTMVGEDGEYAITLNSFLYCKHGGVITVLTSGQEITKAVEKPSISNDKCEKTVIEKYIGNVINEALGKGGLVNALNLMNINITEEQLSQFLQDFSDKTYDFGSKNFYGLVEAMAGAETELFNHIAESLISLTLSFQYNEEHDFYYTNDQLTLQRIGGFTNIYDDISGALTMDLDTEVITYEYGDKEYRLQLWKGNYGYGVSYGGEVGLYSKDLSEDTKWYETVCENDQLRIVQEIQDKNSNSLMKHDTATTSEGNIENGTSYWNLMIRTETGYKKEDLIQITTIYVESEEQKNAIINGLEEAKAELEEGVSLTYYDGIVGIIEIKYETGVGK